MTVSDEHGKGGELLRQQVSSFWQPSSPVGAETIRIHVMYCEVDMIIRYLREMSVDIPDANADLTVYRQRGGTITALATARPVDGMVTEVFIEEAINHADGREALRQNDSVYGLWVRDATSSESADVGIYFGWMPDYYLGSDNPHTY